MPHRRQVRCHHHLLRSSVDKCCVTGSLRWRAPQPPASTSGVQLANTEAPSCYNLQSGYGLAPTNPYRNESSQVVTANSRLDERSAQVQSSEDCLFLKYNQSFFDYCKSSYMPDRVFTPGVNQTEPLPVLVYIHGCVAFYVAK